MFYILYLLPLTPFKLKDFLTSTGITRQYFYKSIMPFARRVSRGTYEMETKLYLSYKRYYESKKNIKSTK